MLRGLLRSHSQNSVRRYSCESCAPMSSTSHRLGRLPRRCTACAQALRCVPLMSSHRQAGYYRFLKLTGEKNRAIQSGVTRPRHDVARSRAECKVRGRLDQRSGCSRSQGGGGRTHSWERWLICFPGCRCRSRSFFVRACVLLRIPQRASPLW